MGEGGEGGGGGGKAGKIRSTPIHFGNLPPSIFSRPYSKKDLLCLNLVLYPYPLFIDYSEPE